ncbi:MAG: RecQ family ATP-dependent DNA helicase, partial [Clostridiales Family XIII bacterium]|nr:RecQ family ATP-dependent DNA helicase [Clostridiales Family XIII bacterium]
VRAAESGAYKLLYVAPERLDTAPFRELAERLAVSMVAVDEAHCISQWGQNFRPSYLKLAGFIELMPTRPVISAFTATATLRVREDIIAALGLRDPLVVVSGFDRPNLYFEVRKPENKPRELLALLRARRGQSGIVYCSTRKNVESVHELLLTEGYPATRYHAGLSDAERRRNQDDFLYDRAPVMAATNAFGMGIDKPDVNFIVHYNMPKSIEAYYQEAGRAGRDGSDAACYLLYSGSDWQTNKFLIERGAQENSELDDAQREAVIEKDMTLLRDMSYYAFTSDCLRRYILSYFGEKTALCCDNCGNCTGDFNEEDATEWARAALNCVHQICARGWPYGKSMAADVLKGSNNEKVRKARLDHLKTYGLLSALPRRRIADLLDRMEQDGLLEVSDGKYPVVTLGEKSKRCKEEGFRYVIKIPKRVEPEQPTGKVGATLSSGGKSGRKGAGSGGVERGASGGTPDREDRSYPEGLFETLRVLRRRLADEAGVPAFVVFSDAALRDMCRVMPEDDESFLSVSGVGQTKLARYGKVFLEEIKAWRGGSEKMH